MDTIVSLLLKIGHLQVKIGSQKMSQSLQFIKGFY
jgi:hypothetical protein